MAENQVKAFLSEDKIHPNYIPRLAAEYIAQMKTAPPELIYYKTDYDENGSKFIFEQYRPPIWGACLNDPRMDNIDVNFQLVQTPLVTQRNNDMKELIEHSKKIRDDEHRNAFIKYYSTLGTRVPEKVVNHIDDKFNKEETYFSVIGLYNSEFSPIIPGQDYGIYDSSSDTEMDES